MARLLCVQNLELLPSVVNALEGPLEISLQSPTIYLTIVLLSLLTVELFNLLFSVRPVRQETGI